MPPRRSRAGIIGLLAAAALFAGACVLVADLAESLAASHSQDDWRRTATGWERRSSWQAVPAERNQEPAAEVQGPGNSLALHPLCFLALQISLAAAGFYVLGPLAPQSTNQSATWGQAIVRSIRATPFG